MKKPYQGCIQQPLHEKQASMVILLTHLLSSPQLLSYVFRQ